MNTFMLLNGQAEVTTQGSIISLVISVAVMFIVFYIFVMIPQKKEQKRTTQMLADMEEGDVILTTSGFYGVLIDITDDDVIVEFGSNKNCRIPMRKSAIAQVEKKN